MKRHEPETRQTGMGGVIQRDQRPEPIGEGSSSEVSVPVIEQPTGSGSAQITSVGPAFWPTTPAPGVDAPTKYQDYGWSEKESDPPPRGWPSSPSAAAKP